MNCNLVLIFRGKLFFNNCTIETPEITFWGRKKQISMISESNELLTEEDDRASKYYIHPVNNLWVPIRVLLLSHFAIKVSIKKISKCFKIFVSKNSSYLSLGCFYFHKWPEIIFLAPTSKYLHFTRHFNYLIKSAFFLRQNLSETFSNLWILND